MKIRCYISNFTKLNKLEKDIKNSFLLRFPEEAAINKKLTLTKFIRELFYEYNYWYATYFLDNRRQCTANRRSIQDLYRLVIFYKPEVKLWQVYRALANLIKEKELGVFYCIDIKKQVYMKRPTWSLEYFVKAWQRDESNLNILRTFNIIQK